MRRLLILVIRCYQVCISPFIGHRCRFYPTCSEFMIEAIEKRGLRGIPVGIRRILRCHPFNQGGYDPLEKWIK